MLEASTSFEDADRKIQEFCYVIDENEENPEDVEESKEEPDWEPEFDPSKAVEIREVAEDELTDELVLYQYSVF